MKKLLALIGLAVAVVGFEAEAQVPTYFPNAITLTNSYVAGTTTFILTGTNAVQAPTIYVGKQRQFALSTTVASSANGVTNIWTLIPSVDGINYDTNAPSQLLYTNAVTGVSTNTVVKSFDSLGAGYYKVWTIVTTGTSTNVAASYSTKIQSP